MPSIRTFIAVRLTQEVLDALENVQARLRGGRGGRAGRWAKVESIHLTLKFLGEVPAQRIEAINQAVARACDGLAPFCLKVARLGCFPNSRRPRVVWAGVGEETGQLLALQQNIERELAHLGFPRERRAFKPHLTLARLRKTATRGEIEALGRSVAGSEVVELARMRVSQVSVMKSDLRPEGAVYTELYAAPLPGDSPPY